MSEVVFDDYGRLLFTEKILKRITPGQLTNSIEKMNQSQGGWAAGKQMIVGNQAISTQSKWYRSQKGKACNSGQLVDMVENLRVSIDSQLRTMVKTDIEKSTDPFITISDQFLADNLQFAAKTKFSHQQVSKQKAIFRIEAPPIITQSMRQSKFLSKIKGVTNEKAQSSSGNEISAQQIILQPKPKQTLVQYQDETYNAQRNLNIVESSKLYTRLEKRRSTQAHSPARVKLSEQQQPVKLTLYENWHLKTIESKRMASMQQQQQKQGLARSPNRTVSSNFFKQSKQAKGVTFKSKSQYPASILQSEQKQSSSFYPDEYSYINPLMQIQSTSRVFSTPSLFLQCDIRTTSPAVRRRTVSDIKSQQSLVHSPSHPIVKEKSLPHFIEVKNMVLQRKPDSLKRHGSDQVIRKSLKGDPDSKLKTLLNKLIQNNDRSAAEALSSKQSASFESRFARPKQGYYSEARLSRAIEEKKLTGDIDHIMKLQPLYSRELD